MGIFSEWQWQYAEHGIATFPVAFEGNDKVPKAKGYLKAGLRRSEALAGDFPHADGIGIALRKNRITVLDVDTPKETVLIEAMDRIGLSPFIVRTANGKWQAYYRNSGEKRSIRTANDFGEPIDILGDGFAVAAPSRGPKGRYEIVQGSLDTLAHLPKMRDPARLCENAAELVGVGARREELLRFLRPAATTVSTEEELHALAVTFANESLDRDDGHRFTDADIRNQVRSTWKWTMEGKNFTGTGRRLVRSHDEIDNDTQLGPDPFFLLTRLQRFNFSGEPFPIANEMHVSMPGGAWSLRRLQQARAAILATGRVVIVRRATTGKAALYRWADRLGSG